MKGEAVKRLAGTIVFVTFAIMSLVVCYNLPYNPKPVQSKKEIKPVAHAAELSGAITKGNHSFISFRDGGYDLALDKDINEVLDILNEFEEQHSELEVTSVETVHYNMGSHPMVGGAWVTHRPRQK